MIMVHRLIEEVSRCRIRRERRGEKKEFKCKCGEEE
jgi:hypothetical protein